MAGTDFFFVKPKLSVMSYFVRPKLIHLGVVNLKKFLNKVSIGPPNLDFLKSCPNSNRLHIVADLNRGPTG